MTQQSHLLGGRVIHHQPLGGFRSGIEPVLLAASVPARTGERVLEAGTGTGAALLCLHARVPGLQSAGVEVDGTISGIAASNAAANGFTELEIVTGDVEAVDLAGRFDHAIANPPYHSPRGTPSPVAARTLAKHGSTSLLNAWIGTLAGHLCHRGTLTLIVASGVVPDCLAAMTVSQCACTGMFPLWPMAGRAAKLVLLRGIRNARAQMRLLPGLVLHRDDGGFTQETQEILREGAALPI